MKDLKGEFWKRIENVRTGMLGIKGQGRLVAMSPSIDDNVPCKIWFITAKGTDLAKGTAAGPCDAQLVICDSGQGLYADIEGTLYHSTNREALDDAWSFVTDSWFEGGQADPDVHLMCFCPQQAEVSITTTSSLSFFYEMAKSKLMDEQPDVGKHGLVVF